MRRGFPCLERHGAAAASIAAIGLFAVAGCGGGDGSGTTDSGTTSAPAPATSTEAPSTAPAGKSDPQLIRDALNAVFASGDPTAACETHVTGNYVATSYGDVDGCKAAQPGAAADSIKVSDISVASPSATATVVPTGGPSNGEKIDVIMIKAGPDWQVDSANSNVPVGP